MVLGFFRFLMGSMGFAPLAEFAVRKFSLNFLDIFAAPIVEPLAFGALKPDKIGLWQSVESFLTMNSIVALRARYVNGKVELSSMEPGERVELSSGPYQGPVLPFNYPGEIFFASDRTCPPKADPPLAETIGGQGGS